MIDAAVIDASVAIKWVVEEDGTEQAESLFTSRLEAPRLLLLECANILWKKMKKGELPAYAGRECLSKLVRSPVRLTPTTVLVADALAYAQDLAHPVYDCVYIALAMRDDLPLITADRWLWTAVRSHRRSPVASHVVLLDEFR